MPWSYMRLQRTIAYSSCSVNGLASRVDDCNWLDKHHYQLPLVDVVLIHSLYQTISPVYIHARINPPPPIHPIKSYKLDLLATPLPRTYPSSP